MSNRPLLSASLILVTLCSSASAEAPREVTEWIDANLSSLVQAYQQLHQSPEVSFEEKETAKKMADHWRQAGYEVTTGVGGHGVVAILENGAGPTVMLRCDLDGLPVTEQTQLPFASTQRVKIEGGGSAGVMHACGHDVHMTNLVGTARFMADHKDRWQGTLMLIAQPAEEKGQGARDMLADGLFERFKKPDFAVALHVSADKPTGLVVVRSGYSQANVDSVDITMKGRGGHGAMPHATIDPIVQAAELVMALQTIVSREVEPIKPAVITVGSIHGGTKHNIIGNECVMQLTVRSYGDDVRDLLLSAIRRKAKAVAASYNAPEPELLFSEGTPSLRNDDELAERLRAVFKDLLGESQVIQDEPSMGGEDFSRYGRAGVPILMYGLGSVDQKRLQRFEKLGVPPPSLHSSGYYPDIEATLRTSLLTMTAAAMELLQK